MNSQLVGDSFVVSSVRTHPSAVVTRIVNWPPTAVLCLRIRRQSSRIHVHTADADATRQNSFVSSAVCIGLDAPVLQVCSLDHKATLTLTLHNVYTQRLRLNDTSLMYTPQSYGMSLAIWDHIVLPATRHK